MKKNLFAVIMNYAIRTLASVVIILGSFMIYKDHNYGSDSLLLGSVLILIGIAGLTIDILSTIDSNKEV